MAYVVDFEGVSTQGLESSPVAKALAGLRANEARYFKNKYDHVFSVEPAGQAKKTIDWVHRILEKERGLVIASPPLEATAFEVEGIRMRCPRSSPSDSNSRARNRSLRAPSAARTSSSKGSTERRYES